jgi:probable phosphoglycerate mutase
MTLFVFRHGETDWNAEQRFQGHIDVPLNENGRNQARNLISILRSQRIESILSSDLSRAFETASLIAEPLQIPVYQDERLREAHLGEAQGLTIEEIEAKLGKELVRRWKSNHLSDADISYPGGETGSVIARRVFEALETFIHSKPYRCIGVACHGGVIRRVMQNLLVPHPDSHHIPIPNGVLYKIHYHLKNKKFYLEDDSNPHANLISV